MKVDLEILERIKLMAKDIFDIQMSTESL